MIVKDNMIKVIYCAIDDYNSVVANVLRGLDLGNGIDISPRDKNVPAYI